MLQPNYGSKSPSDQSLRGSSALHSFVSLSTFELETTMVERTQPIRQESEQEYYDQHPGQTVTSAGSTLDPGRRNDNIIDSFLGVETEQANWGGDHTLPISSHPANALSLGPHPQIPTSSGPSSTQNGSTDDASDGVSVEERQLWVRGQARCGCLRAGFTKVLSTDGLALPPTHCSMVDAVGEPSPEAN